MTKLNGVYDQSGQDFGTAWTAKAYNDGTWPEGAALIADENGAVAQPIRTPISRTADDGAAIVTFYFRTHFNFPGTSLGGLRRYLRHVVDDGAIFYLNGVEVH